MMKAIAALLTRAFQGLGALLVLVCVVRGYGVELQGLFFTFLSLAAPWPLDARPCAGRRQPARPAALALAEQAQRCGLAT